VSSAEVRLFPVVLFSLGRKPPNSLRVTITHFRDSELPCEWSYFPLSNLDGDPVGLTATYPLDRNGSWPIRAARATTSPHVQKWTSEVVLFIKSSLVAIKLSVKVNCKLYVM